MTVWPAVRRAGEDALALLLPVTCAGCDTPDVALCDGCRGALRPDVRVQRGGGVPVASGIRFDGAGARVIRALKEDGRTGLARALAPALRAAAVAVAAGESGVVCVAVPATRASFRRRGYRVPELIARRAGLRTERVLAWTRRTGDQRGLGRDGRRDNVAGALRARRMDGVRVLVIDDVRTTGATLEEAIRALREAGAEVVGAAVVADTPRSVRRGDASVHHR